MLRKLVLGLALAMSTALPLANVAEAAVGDGVVASRGASQLLPIEHVQYVYGGQNYCWYSNGWRGPGYYYCGYAFRTGLGWGGGIGWNNWGGGGWRGGGAGWHGGGWHGGGGGWHMAAVAAGTVAAAAFTAAAAAFTAAAAFMAAVFTAVVVVVVVDAESPHLA
jgi:hypothetical protein